MLTLLKKKPDAAGPKALAWHPNFRNYEKLPDIKVVRTVFFVNVAAITLVVAAAAYVAFDLYSYFSLMSQVAEAEVRIEKDKKASNSAIADFKKFQEEEKKFAEIDAFLTARPTISRLLLQLGPTLPKNLAYSQFELKDRILTIRGIVRGAPELASGEAKQYVETLRSDKVLKELFEEIQLTNMSRNPATGRLNVELVLKLRGPAK